MRDAVSLLRFKIRNRGKEREANKREIGDIRDDAKESNAHTVNDQAYNTAVTHVDIPH